MSKHVEFRTLDARQGKLLQLATAQMLFNTVTESKQVSGSRNDS
jgi:hypothetical protein